MTLAALLAVLLGSIVSPAHAAEYLQTLREGSWVCVTPEAYDRALAEERAQSGDLEDLKKRLLEQKQCIYMDAGFIERMMAPFARVLERQGDKVKVTFTVTFRKRLAYLHRMVSRVEYVGWTGAGNLLDKEIL